MKNRIIASLTDGQEIKAGQFHALRCLLLGMLLLAGMLLPMTVTARAAGPVIGQIPVSCEGTGIKEAFTFRIVAENEEDQSVENSAIQLKDGETDCFRISFTVPGTYRYEITEKSGTDSDVTYDTTVYHAVIYVTEDESGKMAAEAILYRGNSAEKCGSAAFTNTKKTVPEKNKSTKVKSVKTGDMTQIGLWVMCLAVSCILLVFSVFLLRREREG